MDCEPQVQVPERTRVLRRNPTTGRVRLGQERQPHQGSCLPTATPGGLPMEYVQQYDSQGPGHPRL